MKRLRASIRRARRRAEMSQLELGRAIGRSGSFIAWFEGGRNSPAPAEIRRMRRAIKKHLAAA